MAFLGPVEQWRKRVRRAVGALLLLGSLADSLGAASVMPPVESRETAVKAVFLFNFTRFVRWPGIAVEAEQPMVIGVLGSDPFGSALDAVVRGEGVAGRPLEVRRIERLEEALACDELFIARSEEARLEEILMFLEGKAVLTVSDIPEFAARGGMIGLVPNDGRVKIQINPEEAKAAGLQISSKLLRPAEIVSTRRRSNSNQRGMKNVVERRFAVKVERAVDAIRSSCLFATLALPDHGGADARASGSGAIPEQRIEREDGLRAGGGGGGPRVAG